MVDARLNGGLPAFLASSSGLESGMMIHQYTAAALVSENKVLAHPASVDSIPTSANQEDHVSMGSISARHTRAVVENVERVVAIELLVGAQALDARLALLPGTSPAPAWPKPTADPARSSGRSTVTVSRDRTSRRPLASSGPVRWPISPIRAEPFEPRDCGRMPRGARRPQQPRPPNAQGVVVDSARGRDPDRRRHR